MPAAGHPIILYDGVCALCNRIVRFVLRHDRAGQFRFAALQSELARGIVSRHGWNPDDIDTVHLVTGLGTPAEHLYSKSDAALQIADRLGGVWGIVALLRIVPRRLRDFLYSMVVKNRYRTFGKYDSCPLPPAEVRERFLG